MFVDQTRGHRVATILRFEVEHGIRLAVALCPFCGDEHRHVYPADVLGDAPGFRKPRCNGRLPDYLLTPAAPF